MNPGDVFWNKGRICVHLPNIRPCCSNKEGSFAILTSKKGASSYSMEYGPAETGKVICNIVDIFTELFPKLKKDK